MKINYFILYLISVMVKSLTWLGSDASGVCHLLDNFFDGMNPKSPMATMPTRPFGWIINQVIDAWWRERRSQASGGNWRALKYEVVVIWCILLTDIPNYTMEVELYLPAYKVSNDIGVAYKDIVAILFLRRGRSMEKMPKSGFYPSTVLVELLRHHESKRFSRHFINVHRMVRL